MTTKAHAFIVHPLKGGLDTMSAPTILPPDALVTADNIDYFRDGAIRKRPGFTRVSSANGVTSAGAVTITALKSFRTHADGTREGRRFLVGTGSTKIFAGQGGGTNLITFDEIQGSSFGSSGSPANILVAGGYAIFSTMLGTQRPQKWDGVAFGAATTELSDCAPMFGFAEQHLRRVWAAGVLAAPSTVYFSAAGDVTDWEGEDSSSLLFDDGDGDRVVGISKTFRGGIYVFKGGDKGSIHAISGRTIRSFARDKILDTAPAVNHASIVTTPNDIYWLSMYGVHSLTATEKYGNTQEAFLSDKIHNLFQRTQVDWMNFCWGFYNPLQNIVGWAMPESGFGQNTVLMVYNYVQGKWSVWRFTGFSPRCGTMAPDLRILSVETQRPKLYIGDVANVYRCDEGSAADITLGYTARVKFPVVARLGETMNELTEKSFQSVTTFFSPTATNNSAQLNVTIDGRLQTHTVALQSSGSVWGTGTFGTATYGGNSGFYFTETPISDRGRSIQLEYVNSGANKALEIYGYAVRAVPAEGIAMEGS